ncbi:cytochrome P450 [Lentzea sp. NBRC 105346]|uniref:cytochrome P450 n=1 Tax=Lentzea sp. NBRC 105346 TaxID=3032205 RepID=UPI0024A3F907|nr:cytochrome P450 [Lentzea sp. NBRC 105346]GLZ27952.1 cytochrome P450 [Lentzea sp. NBRC 105346]
MTSTQEFFDRLAHMRATEPVSHHKDGGFWEVFGYAEISEMFADPERFSSDLSSLVPGPPEIDMLREGNFVGIDPPRHGQLRGLVNKVFTPRLVAELEPRITELVTALLDEVDGAGRIDLVAGLSHPLPIIVICELLGIPAEDRDAFQAWADGLLDTVGRDRLPTQEELAALVPMLKEMNEYLLGHVRARRAAPGGDLISKLVTTTVDGRGLSDDELFGFVALLLIAGHITTTALIGSTVLCLEDNPDVLALVRADRSLVPAVIEESLRLFPPISKVGRRTTREVELGGATIPAGQILMTWIASANRDGSVFPEPDRFVLGRENRHLAFGHGIHFCLGAPLARLEGRIALNLLMDRYPKWTVARDDVELTDPRGMILVQRLPLLVTG